MKRHLKRYTSVKHYLEFLRRQSSHMQHVYALVFAGSITATIAFVILYVDYGFWHERYIRDDLTVVSTSTIEASPEVSTPDSPSKMLSRFFGEARDRLHTIDVSGSEMLQGKETYVGDSQ